MDWLLILVRELCLVIWLGGLVAIDVIETPIRFRTPGISKEQATAIGSRLFVKFGWIQVLTGAVLLLDTASIVNRTKGAALTDWVVAICVAMMLLMAVIQALYITPQMTTQMVFLDGVRSEQGYQRKFGMLHKAYVSLDVLKLLVGLVVLIFVARSAICQIGA